MTRSAVNRFRTRKLSTKQSLQVLRENQIDSVDDDAQRNIPQIETGVERQEEIEHHLQAAISAAQSVAVGKESKKIFIPTPNTTELPLKEYERLYPKKFSQPASYIRFSSTVEDCCGPAYCMSENDDKFLAKLNQTKRPQVTEDEFEAVMDLYETTIQIRQPYLSMDPSFKISTYEEMESSFDPDIPPELRNLAKLLYSYWKEQKIARGGRPIMPVLKFEQHTEKDDGDPYVCFRRREVRQVRKTRRTDAQSTDKLKRIRQELETARGLVKDVLQREMMRKTQFEFERQIFEKRRTIIDLKRKLGIKGDDEDLISKPKRARVEPSAAPTVRAPTHRDGKPPEQDLRQLAAVQAEEEKRRQEKFQALRKSKLPAHLLDFTQEALFPPETPTTSDTDNVFCSVQTFYLPSPPASLDSHEQVDKKEDEDNTLPVSIAQAPKPTERLPKYRRRVGRGGRIMVDRRPAPLSPSRMRDHDPKVHERFKYDNDEDMDVQPPVYSIDPHSIEQIRFRARMLSPPPEPPHPPHTPSMHSTPVMSTPNLAATPMMHGTPLNQQRRMFAGSPVHGLTPNGPGTPTPQASMQAAFQQAAQTPFPLPPALHNQILGSTKSSSPPVPALMVNGQPAHSSPQPPVQPHTPQQQQQQQQQTFPVSR